VNVGGSEEDLIEIGETSKVAPAETFKMSEKSSNAVTDSLEHPWSLGDSSDPEKTNAGNGMGGWAKWQTNKGMDFPGAKLHDAIHYNDGTKKLHDTIIYNQNKGKGTSHSKHIVNVKSFRDQKAEEKARSETFEDGIQLKIDFWVHHWRCYQHKQIIGQDYLSAEYETNGEVIKDTDCRNYGVKSHEECRQKCARVANCAWAQFDESAVACEKRGMCLLISGVTPLSVFKPKNIPVFWPLGVTPTGRTNPDFSGNLCHRPKRNAHEHECHVTCKKQCSDEVEAVSVIKLNRDKAFATDLNANIGRENSAKVIIDKEVATKRVAAAALSSDTPEAANRTIWEKRGKLEEKEVLQKLELRKEKFKQIKEIEANATGTSGKEQERAGFAHWQYNVAVEKSQKLKFIEQTSQEEMMGQLSKSDGWEVGPRAAAPPLPPAEVLSPSQVKERNEKSLKAPQKDSTEVQDLSVLEGL